MIPRAANQGLEDVIKPDDPVGQDGTADLPAMTFENALLAVQWQGIGIFEYQYPGQQPHTGHAFAQGMFGTLRQHDLLAAIVLIKNGFLLPVFEDLGFGGNDVERFFNLGEAGLLRAGFFFLRQGGSSMRTLGSWLE